MTDAYDSFILSSADSWGVPASWIKAIIGAESGGNPNAYNANDPGGGAYGLMQILYSTAQGLGYNGPSSGLFDPATNIDLGAQLLSQLQAAYGNDFSTVYSAYNSGSATAYQTSATVAANVQSALTWLSNTTIAGVSPANLGLVVAGALAVWFFIKKRGGKHD